MRASLVVSPYRMSGLSRYALELSQSLPPLGIDLDFIEANIPTSLRRVSELVDKLGADLEAFWRTYPLHLSMNDDSRVYHLTHPGLGAALYLSRAKNLVVTVHDIIHYANRDDRQLSTYQHWVHKLVDELSLRTLRNVPAIIAISTYTKTELVKHLDLDPSRIHVVCRSVDLNHFRPLELDSDFWSRHKLDPSYRYVLHLSSEETRKNVPMLIRAFANIAPYVPDAQFLKIGRPQYDANRTRLLQLVKDLGIENRVRFIDWVSDEDLPRFYSIATVFVLPSLFEGFGLPVLEAIACGCPVICSNSSSLPEVVGEAGILVNPTNLDEIEQAMAELLDDRAARAELVARGLERAQNFSASREAEETIAVYKRVLG